MTTPTALPTLRAPFPWFGGKMRASALVWARLGAVPNYVEPFAGSLAVLLGRPTPAGTETVNDLGCYLANFWRALQADPDAVARWADWPVSECDLHARHRWLLDQAAFRARMHTDPDYHDAKIAGWWVWGLSQWIGSGWCGEAWYSGSEWQQLPHLGDAGRGVHRQPKQQLPHLADAGMGVHRQPSQKRPHLGNAGMGVHRGSVSGVADMFAELAARLRRVRVACGDWTRVLGPSVTEHNGLTGILLDPPYSHDERHGQLYAAERDIADDVAAWAVANGDNPRLRIALCGYDGEHAMPETWAAVPWRPFGGYGSQGNGRGRENAHREIVWFSPHCLTPDRQPTLF